MRLILSFAVGLPVGIVAGVAASLLEKWLGERRWFGRLGLGQRLIITLAVFLLASAAAFFLQSSNYQQIGTASGGDAYIPPPLGVASSSPASRGDELRNLHVDSVSSYEADVTVDYEYDTNHGDLVFLGAFPMQQGREVPRFGFAPAWVSHGEGTGVVRVVLAQDAALRSVDTDQMKVMMYIGNNQPFYSRVFNYTKTWYLDALPTLEPMATYPPTPGPMLSLFKEAGPIRFVSIDHCGIDAGKHAPSSFRMGATFTSGRGDLEEMRLLSVVSETGPNWFLVTLAAGAPVLEYWQSQTAGPVKLTGTKFIADGKPHRVEVGYSAGFFSLDVDGERVAEGPKAYHLTMPEAFVFGGGECKYGFSGWISDMTLLGID